jgi:hypothetical protein
MWQIVALALLMGDLKGGGDLMQRGWTLIIQKKVLGVELSLNFPSCDNLL